MIIKYTKNLIISISLIAIIIISSLASIGIRTTIIHNDDGNIISSVSIIKTPADTATYKSYGLYPMDDGFFNNADNIIITNTTSDESYPTMVVSGYNALVAYEYESENSTHVYLRNSINYGQNWSSGYISFSTQLNTFSPSLCIKPFSKTAYCAAVSDYNNSALLFDVEIPNIDNMNVFNAFLVDWSPYGFFNFTKPDIVYYSDPSYPNVPSMTVVIGSTTFVGGPCNNTPMFFYRTPNDPSSSTIAWDAGIENCSNLSVSFDHLKKIFYGACEIKNENKTNIFVFYDNPLTWSENSSLKFEILGEQENFSLTRPQIFFTESQIFITAETDTSGIVIYNSSNGGNTWLLNNVTKDILPIDAKPRNPNLYADKTLLYCIFTESGNISITNSSNLGVNWSTPVQLNSQDGSVIEEYRFSDLPDKDHVVWTDNREGNNDIYSWLKTLPEVDISVISDSIKLTKGEYPMFPTKNYITFTIKNNGNAYIEKVTVIVNYTCKNVSRSTKYPAYILYLDGNGAEKTFYKSLFRMTLIEFLNALRNFAGLQYITITVDPYKIYDDSNPDDNSATIEVGYADIFPKLYFLEKIFA